MLSTGRVREARTFHVPDFWDEDVRRRGAIGSLCSELRSRLAILVYQGSYLTPPYQALVIGQSITLFLALPCGHSTLFGPRGRKGDGDSQSKNGVLPSEIGRASSASRTTRAHPTNRGFRQSDPGPVFWADPGMPLMGPSIEPSKRI